ncbi:hypothetical protein HZB02_01725 [Candidatus Woesearchaeota archaeon]|nr:hypothetical protein [Candidatus Woesearchaeota archaeon]
MADDNNKVKKIAHILKEIQITLLHFVIFEALINTVLLFLVCYLVLILLGITGIYAGIPALAYLGFAIARKLSSSDVKQVEEKHEILRERLRTIRDNQDQDNFMVQKLVEEVEGKLKVVPISSFFNTKKAVSTILITAVLCFLIITATIFQVKVVDASKAVSYLKNKIIKTTAEKEGSAFGTDATYGDQSKLLALGNNAETITLTGEAGEHDQKLDDRNIATEYPNLGSATQNNEQALNKDEQELIKKYFNEVSKRR